MSGNSIASRGEPIESPLIGHEFRYFGDRFRIIESSRDTDDGSSRALGPAAVAVIEQLELVEPDIVDTLRERHVETVKTFGGEPVGEMRPAFQLDVR